MNRKQRRALRSAENSGAGRPDEAGRHLAAALAALQDGRTGDAEKACRLCLEQDAGQAEAWHLMGLAAFRQGRPAEAADAIRRAIARDAGEARYHENLGKILHLGGAFEEAAASYRQAIGLDPGKAEIHNNLGGILTEQGRPEPGEEAIRKALILDPQFAGAFYNLGSLQQKRREDRAAAASFARTIRLAPDFASAHNNLGIIELDRGRPEEAASRYRRALILDPQSAEAHRNLGILLLDGERPGLAEPCFRRALALDSGMAQAHSSLGAALLQSGRLDEAAFHVERAIALSPANAIYYFNLSKIRRFAADDSHLKAMEALARTADRLSGDEQVHLHFALGKAYADHGAHDRSFDHLRAGNALKRRLAGYDEATVLAEFSRIRASFGADLLGRLAEAGIPGDEPVFVLGMPRSGTTLVEQILASHPEVHGAGELTLFGEAVGKIMQADGGSAGESLFSPGKLRLLGRLYRDGLGSLAPGARRITDKMPQNFLFLGLIAMALPQARIVHVRRDPVDTCLSCFATLFINGHAYSYDLAELGRYYRHYDLLMAHWRRVLPAGRMIEIAYESLVADLAGQARRLFDFCGLAWDESCLAFHRTARPVSTASAAQVRRPLYRDSVGRWRPGDDLLRPLVEALGRN